MKKLVLFCILFTFISTTSYSQVSSMGNNSPIFPPNPFLGWDGTGIGGPRTLEVRNDFNRPIEFHTNNTERLRITASGSIQGWPGSTPHRWREFKRSHS